MLDSGSNAGRVRHQSVIHRILLLTGIALVGSLFFGGLLTNGAIAANLVGVALLTDTSDQETLRAYQPHPAPASPDTAAAIERFAAFQMYFCPVADMLCRAQRLGGLAAIERGSVVEGATYLRAALRTDPEDRAALLALAQLSHRTEDYATAAPLLAKIVAQFPNEILSLRERLQANQHLVMLANAQAQNAEGQPLDALEEYRTLLAAAPGHLVAVADGLRLAQQLGDRSQEEFFRSQAAQIWIPTDERLCTDALSAVAYLGQQNVWDAALSARMHDIVQWVSCAPQAVAGQGAAAIADGVQQQPTAALTPPQGEQIRVQNAGFDTAVSNTRFDNGNVEPRPFCWRWVVWDDVRFKPSLWYGGIDDADTHNPVLRISGLWVDQQAEGAAPAAYFWPCATTITVAPGATVEIAVTYRTASEQERAAVALGQYVWLSPAQDWTRTRLSFTNQSAEARELTPAFYLFSPGTVWFDDVVIHRVE